jgi:3',5'-cyclic AMP phosphodiesterase CpdA
VLSLGMDRSFRFIPGAESPEMARVIVLSDVHLSPTHGFFWENWCVARDFANSVAAEAVVVTGDLAINGPDSAAELEFAASALGGLCGQVLRLPGNHDVGDEPPGQDPDQIIDARRLARWDAALGRDRFVHDVGGWRLLGVNAQLFGSGLTRETEQNRWIDAQLAAADLPVALFLHKPLFIDSAEEDVPSVVSLVPSARTPLLEKLRGGNVRLVVSGHLHQHRDRMVDGLRHIWAPAVAFAGERALGGETGCGVLVLDFSRNGVEVAVERPAGLVSHDLAAIKGNGRYKFLRDMPPSPPPIAW